MAETTVVALVPVDWFIPADLDNDPTDMPQYRVCDLCSEAAYHDIWAGKGMDQFRDFYRQVGGVDDGLVVCGNCVEEYLAEPVA